MFKESERAKIGEKGVVCKYNRRSVRLSLYILYILGGWLVYIHHYCHVNEIIAALPNIHNFTPAPGFFPNSSSCQLINEQIQIMIIWTSFSDDFLFVILCVSQKVLNTKNQKKRVL
jgi:hypothetical protein